MAKGYNTEEHGHSDRTMFDSYVADPTKFNDLTGKIVAITGTSIAGLGFFIAEVAIKKNAKMVLCLNRDSKSAKQGEDGLKTIVADSNSSTIVQTIICDMQDLLVVNRAGEEVSKISQEHGGLDVLVLNAGIMATRDTRTRDGFEVQMQTNQLSHFLLTQLLWPTIQHAAETRGEARIVTHSSSARDTPGAMLKEKFFVKSKPKTLGGDKTWMISEALGKEGPWQRYHQTKLANSAFAMELHNRLQTNGISNIRALTADPGVASSNLHLSSSSGRDGLMAPWAAKMLMPVGHSAENGSLSAAMAAFSPLANSGDMYVPNKGMKGYPVKCIQGGKAVKRKGEKLTCNATNQKNVWKFSENALGIKFEVSKEHHDAHVAQKPESKPE